MDDSSVDALRTKITEPWDELKHGPELRQLIVKNAVEGSRLPTKDLARLRTLQAMRRETLPTATSHEAFVRESKRLAELQQQVEQLAEYVHKHESKASTR